MALSMPFAKDIGGRRSLPVALLAGPADREMYRFKEPVTTDAARRAIETDERWNARYIVIPGMAIFLQHILFQRGRLNEQPVVVNAKVLKI
ncbi:hypothetical protein OE766_15015 [Pararhizobium sp. YC-54]|uniref:hypothetical protein n=1 Tax=Pararhizobium sp. YC-54 TaxID=2986920 RepID=UPI0021F73C15|nr:hypothetical protein [Pararhizobium sp. YC-54]MCV9999552.1 hypothetical protein [Pararhizobium sp. YC-54]